MYCKRCAAMNMKAEDVEQEVDITEIDQKNCKLILISCFKNLFQTYNSLFLFLNNFVV